MSENTSLIPMERIERAILLVRGEKVMLDADLAAIYGVETGALNRAVKRNASRFPTHRRAELGHDHRVAANDLKRHDIALFPRAQHQPIGFDHAPSNRAACAA